MSKRQRMLAAIAASALAVSCASPSLRVADFSAQHHFESLLFPGGGYTHVAYLKRGSNANKTLHIYLEHDGPAWIDTNNVATDPTPHHALMLDAMAQDSAPSLYLGRPCYFGRQNDPGCGPVLWTHQRYSELVVNAMATALRGFLASYDHKHLVFLGYSGGGTLAMLLAERFSRTQAVVTVAGNLDIVAWAKRHDYSPLEGSLNPADRQPLPQVIKQMHYVGGRDTNVPPLIIKSVATLPKGSVIELPEYDHVCCWPALWTQILRDLENRLAAN
jgi:pimeloyl-ACP methyl ester carboxylesterase